MDGSPVTPRIYEMDGAKLGIYYFVIAALAALAVAMTTVWLLLLSRPGTADSIALPIVVVLSAGTAAFFAFHVRSARRFKYGVGAEGISVIRDGLEQKRIPWQSVKTLQPRTDGFRLLGANGEHLLDLSHELRGFDDLRLAVLSKIQKPAPAKAQTRSAGGAAMSASARRYERPRYEHVAGSVGFAIVLASLGGFFLYLAVVLHWRFAIGTAIAFAFLALYVASFLLPIRAIEITPECIILEYPWRKLTITIASIKAVAFDDVIGRGGARAWRLAIKLHDGRTIKLATQALGIDEATLYGELCALAPGAVKKS